MELKLIEQTDAFTHVALFGRLDTSGVDQIEPRFNAMLVSAHRHAIVDLSAVEFLSSMGVRMLLAAAKALNRSGSRLILVAPRPLVEGALRHSAIDELIPVRADLAAAREACLGTTPA